jgi:hypothetical protein
MTDHQRLLGSSDSLSSRPSLVIVFGTLSSVKLSSRSGFSSGYGPSSRSGIQELLNLVHRRHLCVANLPTQQFPVNLIVAAVHNKYGVRTISNGSFIAQDGQGKSVIYVQMSSQEDRDEVVRMAKTSKLIISRNGQEDWTCRVHPNDQPRAGAGEVGETISRQLSIKRRANYE